MSARLVPATADVDRERLKAITAQRAASLPDAARVIEYRRYALGRQNVTLTEKQKTILSGLLEHPFVDNICKLAVQAPANRLQLERIDADTENQAMSDALDEFLADLWTFNRLKTFSGSVAFAALRDGNHAIGLRWARDRVRLMAEPWWNGTQGVYVHYDDDDLPDYAVREWKTGDGLRRTVWYPDRIERYLQPTDDDNWRPVMLDGDAAWPVPWVGADGQPLGVPIVHFPNLTTPNDPAGDGSGDDPDSHYGLSVIDGIMGVQDSLNDAHHDLIATARLVGFPMLAATGVRLQTDPQTQKPVPLVVEPGATLNAEDPAARFDVLSPGDLGQLMGVRDSHLHVFSRNSDVPLHLITGDWPSGVALLRAEMRLVEKVKHLGALFEAMWGSAAHKAVVLANAFGRAGLDPDVPLRGVFAPVESNDALTMLDIAQGMKNVGFPFAEIARTMGKQPGEIEELQQEIDQERASSAASFGAAFDAGRVAE